MILALVLALVAVPLLELAVLIKLGQWIGLWPTLAILIFTALAGTIVMQRQGIAAMGRAFEAVAQGRPPIEPVVDGAFIMLAGGLLFLPGLISDVFGILLLIPPIRRLVARMFMAAMLKSGSVRVDTYEEARRTSTRGTDGFAEGDSKVIDGEYTRVDERSINPGRNPKLRKDE